MEVYNFDKKNLTSYGDKFYFFFFINNFNLLGKIAIVIVYNNTCEWIGLTAKFRTREEQLSWGKLGEI